MDTNKYAEIIKQNFEPNRFASLLSSLGDQLNDRKDRFDKADIVEKSFEVYSNGKFKHVDSIGRDHRDNDNNLDLEFKFIEDGLFTPKRKKPKKTVTVKIKNSLGQDKGKNIDNPADFYVFAQTDAMAIISSAELKPYLVSVPDGIEAKIPLDKLTFIFKPNDVSTKINENINYKNIKKQAQLSIINSF